MAESEDFLSGEGVPVDLRDIETELIRLWGPAAERAGSPEPEQPNVTRIVLANLVIVGRFADQGQHRAALETVTTQFPCRTIVVAQGSQPGRTLNAEVSALCHLPAPGLPQVCSERIVLRAGPQSGDLVAGAVRPLLEANLPFALWWTDDPRLDEVLFRELGDECTRLILDLPDPDAEPAAVRLGLDLTVTPHSRDTAWFGVTRWRELVAQFFDAPDHRAALGLIDSVTIESLIPGTGTATSSLRPPRLALWLAAWLAGQLHWRPQGRPDHAGGQLHATYKGPHGPITVAVTTASAPGLEQAQVSSITLTTRSSSGSSSTASAGVKGSYFKLQRVGARSAEVRVEIDSADRCSLPRTVLAPVIDPARRVAAALESSRIDPPFKNALPHLLWLLDGA